MSLRDFMGELECVLLYFRMVLRARFEVWKELSVGNWKEQL